MRPLLLSHSDVVAHLQSPALLDDLRRAFVTHAATPPRADDDGRGRLAGIPASTERVPGGLPGGTGGDVVLLREEPSGNLLAVIDLSHLERVTRAVVGALAVDALSAPDARHVAILGAGPDAGRQLKLVRQVRSLDSLRVWDEDLARAHELAMRLHQQLGLPAAASVTVDEALQRADVVLCCDATASRHLEVAMLNAGAHVNVMGGEAALAEGEAPGHGALGGLTWVYENPDQAPGSGSGPVATTLGAVLGAAGAPFAGEARTAFVGGRLPFQDVVAAWQLFEVLRDDPDIARLDSEA